MFGLKKTDLFYLKKNLKIEYEGNQLDFRKQRNNQNAIIALHTGQMAKRMHVSIIYDEMIYEMDHI